MPKLTAVTRGEPTPTPGERRRMRRQDRRDRRRDRRAARRDRRAAAGAKHEASAPPWQRDSVVQDDVETRMEVFRRAYGEVDPGEALAYVDSYGLVALAVREGRADDDLNVRSGMAVVFSPVPQG